MIHFSSLLRLLRSIVIYRQMNFNIQRQKGNQRKKGNRMLPFQCFPIKFQMIEGRKEGARRVTVIDFDVEGTNEGDIAVSQKLRQTRLCMRHFDVLMI